MLRQISPVFKNLALSTLGHCSLDMGITYDVQRDKFLPFQKSSFKQGHISPNDEITIHDVGTCFSQHEMRQYHAETNFSPFLKIWIHQH